ncbi:MAG: beta-propeller fold lactonase family protein [Candidatus Xenobia bacterium]
MKRTLLTLLVLCVAVSAATLWRVTRTIPVAGDGGWDYLTLDVPTQRLFIARWNRVQVLDLVHGRVVGEIPRTAGVHGVALAPALHRGFTSNGNANTVTMFDLQTLKPLQQIPVGQKPDAIVYDRTTSRVFTMNGKSDDCTAIDAETGKVVGTVSLPGKPEFAVVDGGGHLWVNLEDVSEVAEVDTQALSLMGHWTLAPGENPSGLAIDPDHHYLYSGCHNQKMVVFDTQQHQVLEVLPIGKGVDATAFDPALGLAFSSNGDGTLTVVDSHALKVVQTVQTRAGARTMALDPVHHKIWLCTARRRTGRTYVPGTFVVLEVAR